MRYLIELAVGDEWHDLGEWHGAEELDALDKMARAEGYQDFGALDDATDQATRIRMTRLPELAPAPVERLDAEDRRLARAWLGPPEREVRHDSNYPPW